MGHSNTLTQYALSMARYHVALRRLFETGADRRAAAGLKDGFCREQAVKHAELAQAWREVA